MTILILDDQQPAIHGVYTLLRAHYRGEVVTVDDPEDVIGTMQERDVRALITDYDIATGINGKQLIHVVRGAFGVRPGITLEQIADPELAAFVEENFPDVDSYNAFVGRYGELPIVLHSSTLYGNGENEPLLKDVLSVMKGKDAPQAILDYLIERRVI